MWILKGYFVVKNAIIKKLSVMQIELNQIFYYLT